MKDKTEEAIYDAVESAIDNNVSVRSFLVTVREAWDTLMVEKRQNALASLDSAINDGARPGTRSSRHPQGSVTSAGQRESF